jgi:hypothetical protein
MIKHLPVGTKQEVGSSTANRGRQQHNFTMNFIVLKYGLICRVPSKQKSLCPAGEGEEALLLIKAADFNSSGFTTDMLEANERLTVSAEGLDRAPLSSSSSSSSSQC